MADVTYQQKVYLKQGGDEQVVANGGEIAGESGGAFDAQSGFGFYLGDATVHSADKIGNIIRSLITFTNYTSDGVSVISLPNGSYLAPAYGYAFFSCGSDCSKSSFKLPVPVSGAMLELHFSGAISNAGMSCFAQSGGGLASCSCQTMSGVNVSSFLYVGSTLMGVLQLRCFTDGCWTITDIEGDELTAKVAA